MELAEIVSSEKVDNMEVEKEIENDYNFVNCAKGGT